MKTLEDHTILYDDECPLCTNYTRAFVATGMLDNEGRKPYNESVGKMEGVDWDRARNEIALVNHRDHTVAYGADAIVAVLANRFPAFRMFTRVRPLRWLVSKLYFFISYNRKVVAPGKVFEGANACTPSMHQGYRWAYMLLTCLAAATVLTRYTSLLTPLVPASTFGREFLVCGGQLVFQGVIVAILNPQRWIHYLGNMMTVSLLGALLLLPAFLLRNIITTPLPYVIYFMMVVGVMFLEHYRRVKILELPWVVCFTWVLYRFIVLGLIF
jgi:predicted DCC family thiol-disulfide oxidoreductase YuxK